MTLIGTAVVAVLSAALALIANRLLEPFKTRQAWALDNARGHRDAVKEILRRLSEVDASRQRLGNFARSGYEALENEMRRIELPRQIEGLAVAIASAELFLSTKERSALGGYTESLIRWDQVVRTVAAKRVGFEAIAAQGSFLDMDRRIAETAIRAAVTNRFKRRWL